MLILEGADLVGKTTLAHKLIAEMNQRGWPHVYRHLSKLPDAWRAQATSNYARLMSPYIVQDRFHVSEPVYAWIRGEKPLMTQQNYSDVEACLRVMGGFKVVIVAEPALIERRYVAEREMYPLEKVLEVNALYQIILATGEIHGYETEVHHTIGCTEGNEWPCGITEICDKYERHLSLVAPYTGAHSYGVPHQHSAAQA